MSRTEDLPRSVSGPLDLIEQSVNRVDYYVKNVLEYYQHSKAESLKAEVNFKELFSELYGELRGTEPDMDFHVDVKAPSKFHGDAFRIKVLFSHLLANAIHFRSATQRKPFIKAQVKVDKDFASITLRDNGVGVLEEHMETLFKIFFRNSNSQSRPGRGVGLFIVKEILERIDGQIALRKYQDVDSGIEFEVIIPNSISLDEE
jgi:signal transduction histidine kinase